MSRRRLFPLLLLSLCQLLYAGEGALIHGAVLDAENGKPIPGAIVTLQQQTVRSDAQGKFSIADAGAATTLGVRAIGYRRSTLRLPDQRHQALTLRLSAIRPKALYLSFYGIGSRLLRGAALDLIAQTELNALVIDVKGDRGMIPYRSRIALAAEIGAQQIITVRDMPQLMAGLHGQGIYLIARIVVFKDDLLARARPQWAIKGGGQLWQDREQLSWVDPFQREVWDYNLDIAEEAAALGFDEIQFDYVRFPDAPGLSFSQPNTEANRVQAVNGFLAAARRRLTPYNVFVAADIFGYASWNTNDTFIGQQLEDLVPHLDYLSPMLYPSGFQFGIPGYRNPVAHPREIVALSLQRALQRSGVASTRFRPWLQAFRDYAFDRRRFGASEIRQQIDAAEQFGSDGWMLWNPRNSYSAAGLKDKSGKLIVAPEAAPVDDAGK